MSASYGGEFDGTDTAELIEDRLDALLGRAAGPLMWDVLSPEGAAEQWRSLRAWVSWFRTRFGFDHRVVPPCWYRHGALVELLSALRDHWRAAYDPFNSPTAASEWHRVLAQLEPGCGTGPPAPAAHRRSIGRMCCRHIRMTESSGSSTFVTTSRAAQSV